ncbi:MAG TPA: hydrogenase expression protein HypA/HybF [Synergistaceae bacterium]|nr:hydrogenase expression protein HypA/HybF [Synergistaceae bacterium]HPJ25264.1 hydrogenase expression protein HypA/HybF [Synergistaceae bacterium]HPQ38326.1 hydrogenase expression protein HypA/HybF [Synergistaceae bacterium]
MRKFRCIECSYVFESEEKPDHCPRCKGRFIQLVEGEPLKGKRWGSKSYSVK